MSEPHRESYPKPIREKQETLYRGLEDKIAIMKGIWGVAQSLSIPSIHDSNDDIAREKDAFQHVFQSTLDKLPQAASIYREQGSDTDAGHLKQDLDFIRSMDNGINDALRKRDSIRAILRDLGENPSPEAYEKTIPEELEGVRGHIQRVIIKPFSINLVLDREGFQSVYQDLYGKTPTETFGSHIDGTIWNIYDWYNLIKNSEDYLMSYVEKEVLSGNENIQPNLSEIEDIGIKHEDFHSFMDGFDIKEGNINKAIRTSIVDLSAMMQYRRRLIHKIFKTLRIPYYREFIADEERKEWKDIRRNMQVVMDSGHEELLAELASAPDITRALGMRGSFVNRRQQDTNTIKTVVNNLNENIPGLVHHPYITQTLESLDPNLNNQFIIELYEQVEANAPERVEDLDMAFALFPPSQWRHIKGLVARWTSEPKVA